MLSYNLFEALSLGPKLPDPIIGFEGFSILFPSPRSVNAAKFLSA